MISYSAKFPSIIKFAVITDLTLRHCLRNKRSIVSVGSSDVIDCFVDNLTSSKLNKWKTKKKVTNHDTFRVSKVDANSHTESANDITKDSVDDYILKNLTSPKLTSVLNMCLYKRICPSQDTMVKLARTFAQYGNKDCIDILVSISKIDENSNGRRQEEYRIFQAEAIWRSGASTEKSLQLLDEVYREQPALRRHVRSSLRPLLAEVILNRGEASLMQAKKLVLNLASFPYEDHVPLSFLWSRCILSECFADQQMAVELVEVSKGSAMFKRAVGTRVDGVLGEAFSRHQIEAVYRLLEALLKLAMTKHSQHALEKLFDYKYLLGDVAGCDAVLKACDDLDLDVGFTRRKQLEKLKDMRLSRHSILSGCEYQRKKQNDDSCRPTPKFKLKL